MNQENKLSQLINQLHSLPTLPTTYTQIQELLKNPKTSARDISEIIRKDQALTARLLKLINSAFYGFQSRITTVPQAVVLLGFKTIKNLVLSTSVLDLFKKKQNMPEFDMIGFWKHSLSVAVTSKIIGQIIKYEDPEELFVAGLLHDIGKLIHFQYYPDKFQQILTETFTQKRLIFTVELELLGFNHCETGKLLLEKWKLPSNLVEAVALHHAMPSIIRTSLHASVVHIADVFVRIMQLGNPGDPMMPPLFAEAFDKIGLIEHSLPFMVKQIHKQSLDAFLLLNSESNTTS